MLSKKVLLELGLDPINSTLFKQPRKDKGINQGHYVVHGDNAVQQADILYLPNDNGYKYALVVVDIGSKLTDAEPIKNKTPEATLQAIKTIYKRGIIKLPSEKLQVDAGSEFKGVFKKYFESINVYLKFAIPGRHRMQAVVENRNGLIGKYLFEHMVAVESTTGQESSQWVKFLPKVIMSMNNNLPKKTEKKLTGVPLCQGEACNLLAVGDKVLIQLDNPVEYFNGKKLHGKFRASDTRFSKEPYEIVDVVLAPDTVPLYIIKGFEKTGFTRSQLVPVDDNFDDVDVSKLTIPKNSTYVVAQILGKQKIKNKIFYNVLFKGHKTPELTARTELIKSSYIKKMLDEFDKKNN